MLTKRAYHTLVSSLPALPARFDVDRCPITWPRLQARLQMLEPDDYETLTTLIEFLAWDQQPVQRTDEEVIARHRDLMSRPQHRLVREIVEELIDQRVIISALRRHRLNLPPPPNLGQWAQLIRRRWNVPQFGLQMRFPWIAQLEHMLRAGQADEAERLILSVAWQRCVREADNHHFSFDAVLLYVARWSIINRWTSRDAAAGRQRFETILSKLLESHGYFNS